MSNRITFSPRVPDSAVTLGLMKIFTTDVDINHFYRANEGKKTTQHFLKSYFL